MANVKNSQTKQAYMYLLTSNDMQEKSAITARFLNFKIQQHTHLPAEIEKLRKDNYQIRSLLFRQLEINQ